MDSIYNLFPIGLILWSQYAPFFEVMHDPLFWNKGGTNNNTDGLTQKRSQFKMKDMYIVYFFQWIMKIYHVIYCVETTEDRSNVRETNSIVKIHFSNQTF